MYHIKPSLPKYTSPKKKKILQLTLMRQEILLTPKLLLKVVYICAVLYITTIT